MNDELPGDDLELIQEVFDGMFQDLEYSTVLEDARVADPTPPVPLASNLILLLTVGLILGFYYSKSVRSLTESKV